MIDYSKKYERFNDGAFYGNHQLKADLLAQLQAHFDADEIVKGLYWEEGKGCHVGCCIHGSAHDAMAEFFGIPEWLCYLFDKIFEGLPNEQSKIFPLQSIGAIVVGSDIEPVRHHLAIWRLSDPDFGVCRFNPDPSILAIAALHERSLIDLVDRDEWSDASAIESAAWSAAESAARSAVESADWSTAWSTESAAWSAVESAESAARSAESATEGAAWSAVRSAVRSADWSAARSAAWSAESKKLIELLKNAKS